MTRSDLWKYVLGTVIGVLIVRLLFELVNPVQRPLVAAVVLALASLGILLYKGASLKIADRWIFRGCFLSFSLLAILFYLQIPLSIYHVAAIIFIPILLVKVFYWAKTGTGNFSGGA